MMHHWLNALLLTICTNATAHPTSSGSRADQAERLEAIQSFMNELVEDAQIGGAAAMVTIDGEEVFLGTAGSLQMDGRKPITEDAIYRIFSMTKPITTVATLMCYENGDFLLGDPVSQYLPEFSDMQVASWPTEGEVTADDITLRPATRPITISDLLTHTSGMFYFEGIPVPLFDQLNQALGGAEDLADLSRRLAELPLAHEPGERWTYSISPTILGRLVEVVSGQRFGEFCQEHIFTPLQMPDTGFALTDPERLVDIHFAMPTAAQTGTNRPTPGPQLLQFMFHGINRMPFLEAGDAGMFSTLRDYERFVRMLMQDGELDGHRILSPATVRFMRTNHLTEDQGSPPWFGGPVMVGFNTFLPHPDGHGPPGLASGSFLGGGAATTAYFADPSQRGTAVFMTALLPTDNALANTFMRLAQEAMKP